MRKKYPGIYEAEEERIRVQKEAENRLDNEPDFIGLAPNYSKFRGWSPEAVMVFLNVD